MLNGKFNNKIYILIIIFCYIGFSTFLAFRYLPDKELSSDQELYRKITNSIIQGNSYYFENGEKVPIASEVTPFYSLLIAIPYSIAGQEIIGVYVFQVLLSFFSVILFFKILKEYTNNLTAFIITLVLIFYYPIWRMNFSIMFEVVTIFFLLLSFYLIGNFLSHNKPSFLYLAFSSLSITILINNRFVFHFVVLFAVLLLILLFRIKRILKTQSTSLRKYFIGFSIPIIILTSWNISQTIIYKEFIFFTPLWTDVLNKSIRLTPPSKVITDTDVNTWKSTAFGSYEEALTYFQESGFSRGKEAANEFKFSDYDRLKNEYFSTNSFDIYRDRLINFFRIGNFRYRYSSAGDPRLIPPSSVQKNAIDIMILLPIFVLSFVGFLYALKNRNILFLIVALFIFSHIFLHIIVAFIERYRITILPLFFLLAGYGIYTLFPKINNMLNIKRDNANFPD